MEWEREGNNAEHRWVSDTKENRQIRAERMWKRMRLTRWRPSLVQSTASVHWRSCRTSNPVQRPSLPSRCVVWLSSDHPHAGYGNLSDRRDGRDICGLCLLPITYSLSATWALFFETNCIFNSISALPSHAMNQTSPDVTFRKKDAYQSEPRIFSTLTWTK